MRGDGEFGGNQGKVHATRHGEVLCLAMMGILTVGGTATLSDEDDSNCAKQ